MPIKDLSDTVRLPRLGKIHLGIRHPEKGYPMKTDYFVLPKDHSDYQSLVKIFGEKPKELRIFIPVEDEEIWATQYYKAYTLTHGLVCKGDGETAMRVIDIKTGNFPDKTTGTAGMRELPCEGKDCPEYKSKKCKETMNLRFVLPEVPGLGVWQIDTGSINSILNINSCAKMIKKAFGRISLIPLKLTLESISVNNPETGKKQNVFVLNLRSSVTFKQLADTAREQINTFMLEAPDLEAVYEQQIESDIEALWPEAKQAEPVEPKVQPEPVKAPPEQPSKAPVAQQEAQQIAPEIEGIDVDWARASIKELNWITVLKHIQTKFKITANKVSEAIKQMTVEQRKEFGRDVQERLDLKNQ